MLSELQSWIEETYRLEPESPVADYLIDRAQLERHLDKESPYRNAEEVLLLRGDAQDCEVGLFLHPKFGLEKTSVAEADTHGVMTALEGVSHLLLSLHRLKRSEGLTQLELELQAEVDKFLFLRLMPDEGRRAEAKRHLLSEANLEGLSRENLDRYAAARRLAHRYCLHLEETYLAPRSFDGLYRELPRFYRMSHWRKLQALGAP